MFYDSGIGPLGCIPHQLGLSQQPTCVSSVNAQAQDFNTLLKSMLQGNTLLRSLVQWLNTALPHALFLFGETYDAVLGLIDNPGAHGFTVVNQGCCGGGLYRGVISCQAAAMVCTNRAEYVFWDAYHPTEASALIPPMGSTSLTIFSSLLDTPVRNFIRIIHKKLGIKPAEAVPGRN